MCYVCSNYDVNNHGECDAIYNIFTKDKRTINIDKNKQFSKDIRGITYFDTNYLFIILQDKIYQCDGTDGQVKFEYDFSLNLEDNKVTKVLDGHDYFMSDPDFSIESIVEHPGEDAKNEYVILYKTINGSQYGHKMYKYKYSKELSKEERTQINVFSLYDNKDVILMHQFI